MEGGRERGREGREGREGVREGVSEGVSEGGSEGGSNGGREGGREGGGGHSNSTQVATSWVFVLQALSLCKREIHVHVSVII